MEKKQWNNRACKHFLCLVQTLPMCVHCSECVSVMRLLYVLSKNGISNAIDLSRILSKLALACSLTDL